MTLRPILAAGTVLAALLVLTAVSLSTGPAALSLTDVVRGLTGTHADPDMILIVREARLPRTGLALLAGAALAAAGALLQTVTLNPLASPSVLGIGAGANLALLSALVFVPELGDSGVLAACFLGALLSAAVIGVAGFSSGGRLDRDRLVVAGTVLAALETGITGCILFLHGMQQLLLGWTLGRLVNVDPGQLRLAVPLVLLGLAAAVLLAPRLEALLLGDHGAASLGVRVGALQSSALLVAVVLAATAVAAAGPVPFVGLIAPHLVRRSIIATPPLRLATCAAAGAVLAGLADLLSRTVTTSRPIPMGLWMMAVGSIFFFARSRSR